MTRGKEFTQSEAASNETVMEIYGLSPAQFDVISLHFSWLR